MRLEARIGILFLFALVLAACSGGSSRGTTYSISGVVADKDGQGIEGVTLSITGGTTMAVVSGEGGHWTASGLRGEVTVTPVGDGLEFDPPNYRLSSARDRDDVSFTAHLAQGTSRAQLIDAYVTGRLEEKAISPRYLRTYTYRLKFLNPTEEEGRIMVWAYLDGVNRGIQTVTIPPGTERSVEIWAAFGSDDIHDNIFDDGFEVIIEGAQNVPPELIELEFRGWSGWDPD